MIRTCRMQAIWYSIHAEISIDTLVEELSSLWGKPNGQSKPDISGSGLWRGATWRVGGLNIWAIYDVANKLDGVVVPRLVVYARRDMPRDSPDVYSWHTGFAIGNQVIDSAAQMATRDSALTAAVLNRTHCRAVVLKREANSLTLNRLSQWLDGSADWPPQRRAAILLVADAYLACAQLGPSPRLVQLGAKFKTNCPQDGPVYSGNFRDQAEKLDPHGLAGELASLAGLAAPCSLKGHQPWPDLLIEKAGGLLNEFPRDQWTPWMLYAIASAHAAKLSFRYPGGDPEGEISPLTAAAMQQERKAAIEYFKQFIREKPDAPESVFAWQEAWRLLAGLPPSRVGFGCGCE